MVVAQGVVGSIVEILSFPVGRIWVGSIVDDVVLPSLLLGSGI